MAYPYKYYRYLSLPPIPQSVTDQINRDFDQYEKKDHGSHGNIYTWSDSFNQVVNDWCQQNICSEMYWGFQIIRGDLRPHIDHVTKVKLTYLVDLGGDSVVTEWFDHDQTTLLDSVVFEANRWHILKVDTWHGIRNVDRGGLRLSITGRVF